VSQAGYFDMIRLEEGGINKSLDFISSSQLTLSNSIGRKGVTSIF